MEENKKRLKRESIRRIQHIISILVRISISLYMIYRAYTETGIWTALIFLCILVYIEAENVIDRERIKFAKRTNQSLRALIREIHRRGDDIK